MQYYLGISKQMVMKNKNLPPKDNLLENWYKNNKLKLKMKMKSSNWTELEREKIKVEILKPKIKFTRFRRQRFATNAQFKYINGLRAELGLKGIQNRPNFEDVDKILKNLKLEIKNQRIKELKRGE